MISLFRKTTKKNCLTGILVVICLFQLVRLLSEQCQPDLAANEDEHVDKPRLPLVVLLSDQHDVHHALADGVARLCQLRLQLRGELHAMLAVLHQL